MTSPAVFAPAARKAIRDAVIWIAADGPDAARRALPQGASENDIYAVDQDGDGRGLSRALCPGADEVWLIMSRVRAPRPLTMQAVGRWSDGAYRHCVTLSYEWRGEWATAPTPPALPN